MKKSAGDNSLGNNLLGTNSFIYIDNNIDIDIKVKSNSNKDMTNNNLFEKNSRINIKDLFQ